MHIFGMLSLLTALLLIFLRFH